MYYFNLIWCAFFSGTYIHNSFDASKKWKKWLPTLKKKGVMLFYFILCFGKYFRFLTTKCAIFTLNNAMLWQKFDHNLGFQNNAHFSAENLRKRLKKPSYIGTPDYENVFYLLWFANPTNLDNIYYNANVFISYLYVSAQK
jgi:hypothetical protein